LLVFKKGGTPVNKFYQIEAEPPELGSDKTTTIPLQEHSYTIRIKQEDAYSRCCFSFWTTETMYGSNI